MYKKARERYIIQMAKDGRYDKEALLRANNFIHKKHPEWGQRNMRYIYTTIDLELMGNTPYCCKKKKEGKETDP